MKRAQDPVRVQLNAAVKAVERYDRSAAIVLLAKFDALRTTELMPEQLQPALVAFEAALQKFEAVAP